MRSPDRLVLGSTRLLLSLTVLFGCLANTSQALGQG